MTVMGMAASQARFLGLTSRKSNVEYQGQQINQERTALANESANLFSQMMSLEVPTPPVQSEYYNYVYSLDDSMASYASDNYTIGNYTKTYVRENEYIITLNNKVENKAANNTQFKISQVVKDAIKAKNEAGEEIDTGKSIYKIQLAYLQSPTVTTTLVYNENETNAYTGEKGSMSINQNQIYAVSDRTIDGFSTCYPDAYRTPNYYYLTTQNEQGEAVTTYYKKGSEQYNALTPEQIQNLKAVIDVSKEGFAEAFPGVTNDNLYSPTDTADKNYFFYQDANKVNHFLTEDELNIMIGENSTNQVITTANMYTYKKDYMTQVIGTLEKSKNGRLSSITINDNEEYPVNLKGKTFSLSTTKEYDEERYNDDFNEYEYQKSVYEKTISDLNNKTEILQKEDQGLELRLDQLDTEQKAISTEIDSVSKVIKDNVEKTFKIFA